MNSKFSVIYGDGIGPEVITSALEVYEALNEKFNVGLEYIVVDAGLSAYKKYGTNLPEQSINAISETCCLLKGPTTTLEEPGSELGVPVKIRKRFDLFANIRPVKSLPGVKSLYSDLDILIVRENTEGMYSGAEYMINKDVSIGVRVATRAGAERVFRVAFREAEKRRRQVTLGHKANVLKATDMLYKQVFYEVSREFELVKASEMHIDALAMNLILKPQQFDVIVTENLFGDIISDEASALVGGLGLSPSANIGERFAMFEPVHGSAPDIAGKGIANPIAAVLSLKMLLEWAGAQKAASSLESAVRSTLSEGRALTPDLGGSATTKDLTKEIIKNI